VGGRIQYFVVLFFYSPRFLLLFAVFFLSFVHLFPIFMHRGQVMWTLGLFVGSAIQSLCSHQYFFRGYRVGLHVCCVAFLIF
jgi:hypothetical protein